MRLNPRGVRFASRASVAVAVCIATVAALGFSAPRGGDATRDRDLAVRLTRSGPQRLDAPDALHHSHEETEPDSIHSSLVLDRGAVGAWNGPAPAAPVSEEPASAPDFLDPSSVPAGLLDFPAPLRTALSAPSPGRAPPVL